MKDLLLYLFSSLHTYDKIGPRVDNKSRDPIGGLSLLHWMVTRPDICIASAPFLFLLPFFSLVCVFLLFLLRSEPRLTDIIIITNGSEPCPTVLYIYNATRPQKVNLLNGRLWRSINAPHKMGCLLSPLTEEIFSTGVNISQNTESVDNGGQCGWPGPDHLHAAASAWSALRRRSSPRIHKQTLANPAERELQGEMALTVRRLRAPLPLRS